MKTVSDTYQNSKKKMSNDIIQFMMSRTEEEIRQMCSELEMIYAELEAEIRQMESDIESYNLQSISRIYMAMERAKIPTFEEKEEIRREVLEFLLFNSTYDFMNTQIPENLNVLYSDEAQELCDTWGKSFDELLRTFQEDNYSPKEFYRLQSALNRTKTKLENRELKRVQDSVAAANSSDTPDVKAPIEPKTESDKPWEDIVFDELPAIDLEDMIDYIRTQIKFDSTMLFELSRRTGIEPARLTDIVTGHKVTVSELNTVYRNMKSLLRGDVSPEELAAIEIVEKASNLSTKHM